MHSQAVDDVLDPVLQQFYSSSSSHSSSVLKVPVVSQRTTKKCTKGYDARAQLLFCSLNNTDGPLFGDPQNVLHNENHEKFLLSEKEIIAN